MMYDASAATSAIIDLLLEQAHDQLRIFHATPHSADHTSRRRLAEWARHGAHIVQLDLCVRKARREAKFHGYFESLHSFVGASSTRLESQTAGCAWNFDTLLTLAKKL